MARMRMIKVMGYHCEKCGYDWVPKKKGEIPRCCARCHVITYDEKPRKRMRM
jgi:hypothetical protein